VSSSTTVPAPTLLAVHVAGAVNRPGLHLLPAGARVDDAVRAAGGATSSADLDAVTLARAVVAGEQVFIPRRGQRGGGAPSAVGGGGAAQPRAPAGPVDLNTASAAQLESLPGIGPSIAAAIVAHRGKIGVFVSVEELLDVPGIGPAKMEAIRPLVAVR